MAEELTGNRPGVLGIDASLLKVDPELLHAVILGTRAGLEMTGIEPLAVGVSRMAQAPHPITAMVGLVGRRSGNMALNLSQCGLMFMVGRLLGEAVTELNEDSIDAIMEIGNMIGGGVRGALLHTGYGISQLSLPSLVFGSGLTMVYARGIQSVSVQFELPGLPFTTTNDRFFSTTVSLLRGSGTELPSPKA